MSIWKILGFGTNHERIAKYNQKAIEHQNVKIRNCCSTIMIEGIKSALKNGDKGLIVAVLKKWHQDPDFYNYGVSRESDKNWKEAQKWLYEQEHPDLKQNKEELKEIKKKMQEMEEKIAENEKNK